MTLEERAAAAARKARCGRCQEVILETPSAMGVVTGHYRAVALKTTSPFKLCGECGLGLREFLNPRLKEDAAYNGFKRLIRELWSK